MTPVSPRYKSGGDNRALAFALFDAWKYQCYWCELPKQFFDIEIDHIVPRAKFDAEREALNLPGTFDVDGLENLAPICHPCNTKRKRDDTRAPRLTNSDLQQAARRRSVVLATWMAHRSGNRLAQQLVAVAQAPATMSAERYLRQLGPAVLNRLHEADPEVVEAYESLRVVDLRWGPVGWSDLVVRLDAERRSDLAYVTRFCGEDPLDAIADQVVDTLRESEKDLRQRMQAVAPGPEAVGTPSPDRARVNLIAFDLTHEDPERARLRLELHVDAQYAMTWYGFDDTGSDTYEVQIDGSIEGPLVIDLSALFADGVYVDDVSPPADIEAWRG